MEQAYINGVALSQYGVVLLKGWREAFLLPANNKDYVQNESRLEHGIRIDASLAKKKEREITLQFFLEGATDDDYIDKLEAFINVVGNGEITMRIPSLKNRSYKLVYTEVKQYGMYGSNKGKFVINFIEPTPNDNSV